MHDKLTKKDIEMMERELEDRRLNIRPKIMEEVKRTRAFGDLSENYEYKAAKQAQNQNRSRIRYLEGMIKTAKVYEDDRFMVTARIGIYDGYPAASRGFGQAPDGSIDLAEPKRLVRELHQQLGLDLLDITMGNPYVNPHVNRPFAVGPYDAPEAPLTGVARMLNGTAALKKSAPEIKLICSALSYLGAAAPRTAAGYIEAGGFDFAGFGRTIFAYPDFARDILREGGMKKEKCCVCCSKCSEIMRAGSTPGCVIRDKEVYGPIYRAAMGRE